MDKSEAGELLRSHLNPWRIRSYRELADRIGETDRLEVSGASETQYQVTIQVFWDSRPDGDIRVVGSIDDGGWRAFLPLSDSFIKAPDGDGLPHTKES
jgi:hypothetical protein